MSETILKVEKLSKSFGGIHAVSNLSFEVKKGEIIGLMGPNGAGKTTLINMISGELKPDSGRILFKNKDITKLGPHAVSRIGIARTYQIPQPFFKLSCLENVAVGIMYGRGFDKEEALCEAREILEFVGFARRAEYCSGELDEISLKRLELARALSLRPELLLIDEFAAGLTEFEIPQVLDILKRINEELGVTVLLIEHVMKVMLKAVKRVVVMDKGTKIAEGSPSEIMENKAVIEAYFG